MKKILSFAIVFCMILCLAACTSNNTDISENSQESQEEESVTLYSKLDVKANVYGLVGPTGVGLANMMAQQERGESLLDYSFNLVTAPDAIVSKLTTGEADLAAVPTNLAASLYKKTSGNIVMVAINTECVLNFVENGNSIASIKDLKGKTIYSTGEGSNPEYILRYILSKNGLDPDTDVSIKFVTENEELAALLIKGEAQVALVPEPLCTTVLTKNENLRIAVSVNDAWKEIEKDTLPLMGCVVATKDFVSNHKDALKTFLFEYENSIDMVKEHPEDIATYCEKYGIIASEKIALKAFPNCHLTFISGKDMKPSILDYFQVLFDANPKSIGGSMPEDGFYYSEE